MSATIVTTKPGSNYGGILQAWALQSFLRKMGIPAEITSPPDVSRRIPIPLPSALVSLIALGRKSLSRGNLPRQDTVNNAFEVDAKLAGFVASKMNVAPFSEAKRNKNTSILIVGSDQVWRASKANMFGYMLGNAYFNNNLTCLSYAASFGVGDNSEFTPFKTIMTRILSTKFNAISVREESGIQIVKELWGRDDAQWHVDPTMLLNRAEYDKLIDEEFPGQNSIRLTSPTTGIEISKSAIELPIASYVLDKRDDIAEATAVLAASYSSEINQLLKDTPPNAKAYLADPERYNKISVPAWLKGIRDAKLLVTDSFHGCVFAILFHTPFIVVPNGARGRARFDSLLGLFNLTDRMVDPDLDDFGDTFASIANQPIGWDSVDAILQRERERGLKYLRENLQAPHATQAPTSSRKRVEL